MCDMHDMTYDEHDTMCDICAVMHDMYDVTHAIEVEFFSIGGLDGSGADHPPTPMTACSANTRMNSPVTTHITPDTSDLRPVTTFIRQYVMNPMAMP